MAPPICIALVTSSHIGELARYVGEAIAQSGRDGDPITAPYSRAHQFDSDKLCTRLSAALQRTIGEPGWKRAWAAFDGDRIVGQCVLHGSVLDAELHRAQVGMSVSIHHRRQGLARAMLRAAVEWARASELSWIELGVFAGNTPARALYEEFGFEQIGLVRDRFRVDGVSVDDVRMALKL